MVAYEAELKSPSIRLDPPFSKGQNLNERFLTPLSQSGAGEIYSVNFRDTTRAAGARNSKLKTRD
jgi:hypothetical protein